MAEPLDLEAIESRLDFGHADSWALLEEVKRLRADLALMTQVAEKGRDVAQLAGRQRDQAREQRDALILACDATRAERDHAVEERRALAARAVSVVVAASEQRNASGAVASLGSAAKLARAIDALAGQVGETPKNWSPSWDPVRADAEHEAARLRLLGESDARELLKAETSRDALEARLEQARATAGAMVHAQWCLARLNPAPGVCECGLFVLRAALEPGAGS